MSILVALTYLERRSGCSHGISMAVGWRVAGCDWPAWFTGAPFWVANWVVKVWS